MNKEVRFQEMLEEVSALARVNGNRISKALVEQFFEELSLSKEQFELIYRYFDEKKIRVEEEADLEAIEDMLAEAEENGRKVEIVSENDEKELEILCLKVENGEREAKDRLIGLFLERVVAIANEYENEAVLMDDLIQEGNLGLVIGIEELSTKSKGISYERFLEQKIREAILQALEEEYQSECADEELEKTVNEFHKKVLDLKEDLERSPSLEEISFYTKMPVEEVKGLFRMMGEEVDE